MRHCNNYLLTIFNHSNASYVYIKMCCHSLFNHELNRWFARVILTWLAWKSQQFKSKYTQLIWMFSESRKYFCFPCWSFYVRTISLQKRLLSTVITANYSLITAALIESRIKMKYLKYTKIPLNVSHNILATRCFLVFLLKNISAVAGTVPFKQVNSPQINVLRTADDIRGLCSILLVAPRY